MSSSDIEDVLSQVRRLVSEDLRPVAGRDAPARTDGQGAGKLMLTPALRVVPQTARQTTLRLGAEDPPDDDREISSLQTAFDAALRAEAARRAEHAPPHFGTSRSAPVGQPLPLRLPVDEPPMAGRAADAAPEGGSSTPDGNVSVATGASFAHDYAPPPFAQVPSANDEQEPVAGQSDTAQSVMAAAHLRDGGPAPMPPSTAESAAEGLSGSTPPGDDIVGAFASVRARHGAAWADRAAAEAAAQIAKGEPRAQVFDPDQEMNFDEEVLRDLVRDILREQLQGALGERITRNVRKLVRAELNRALLGREQD